MNVDTCICKSSKHSHMHGCLPLYMYRLYIPYIYHTTPYHHRSHYLLYTQVYRKQLTVISRTPPSWLASENSSPNATGGRKRS